MCMVAWDITAHVERLRIENASQLARLAGLSYPVAWRVWKGGTPLERIDVSTLERLAKAFNVRKPLTLLKYTR